MRVSLIITTFNWKEALELSVLSVFNQKILPSEIIIADDGSGNDTRDLIVGLQKQSPVPLIHSRQHDKGFRLSRSRNKGLALAKSDYIILIDGDIVVEKHFVADHIQAAKAGCFIQGSRVILSKETTTKALSEKLINFPCNSPGMGNRKNCFRSDILSLLCRLPGRRLHGIKTCNFGFWRRHAVQVNGFNEDFLGWGREDSEFTARLLHSGIARRNLKFKAVAYHLHHKTNSRDQLAANDAILKNTLVKRLLWCDNGLSQHMNTPPKQ